MELSLFGYRALVCGSTGGIGKAAAVELASLGAEVVLMARNPEKLLASVADLPNNGSQAHRWVVADFADPGAVRDAARDLIRDDYPVHILVNNTGGPPGGALETATPAALLEAFNAHVICNHHLMQAAAPGMRRDGYGRIINIISTSVKAPIPNLGVSNTIRAAVASWAKTLAGELGPYGITVNNILPGYTETERLTSLVRARAEKGGTGVEDVRRELMATIPAGRFGAPAELGAAVAFLASPAAGYINGINLPVDGGRLPTL